MPPPGPLSGIKVLDLSRLLPGAFATQILVDLGAEVWKIEEVGKGDYMRYAPPFIKEYGAMFLAYNRGKKSACLNLKKKEGVEIFKKWMAKADILVESFRPGVMERLGINYEVLKKLNPKLIYCAITGYGQSGPYAQKAGHDINYLSLAGALSLQGTPERPVLSAFQLADCAGGGMFSVIAILLALFQREKTDKGVFIDTAMFEGVAYWMSQYYAMSSAGENLEREKLPLSGGLPHYRVYPTKDGRFIGVGSLEPKFLTQLCQATGVVISPQGLLERSFGENEQKMLEEIFKNKTLAEWEEVFASLDACVEPVRSVEEALTDPHLNQRGVMRALHLKDRTIHCASTPIRFDHTLFTNSEPPPRLGEHTDEAMQQLGYNAAEIARLKKNGTIG